MQVSVSILYIRKDCKVTSTLNSQSDGTLMLCAVACDPSRKDLAALRDVSLKLVYVLIADLTVLAAEYADFLSSAESALLSSKSAFTAFAISLVSHSISLLLRSAY